MLSIIILSAIMQCIIMSSVVNAKYNRKVLYTDDSNAEYHFGQCLCRVPLS